MPWLISVQRLRAPSRMQPLSQPPASAAIHPASQPPVAAGSQQPAASQPASQPAGRSSTTCGYQLEGQPDAAGAVAPAQVPSADAYESRPRHRATSLHTQFACHLHLRASRF